MKTPRLFVIWSALATTLLLFSCQKEVNLQDLGGNSNGNGNGGGTNTQSFVGDYNFAGIEAKTKTTVTVTDPLGTLKSVTTSNYTSTNNSGTVKFTNSEMSYTDLAYAISTTAHVQLFLGSTLLSESDMPFDVPPTPMTGADAFTKFSNDSITFTNPIFIANNPFAATTNPKPMGAKLSWKSDTLIMRIVDNISGTVTQAGTPANYSGDFDLVAKFKKK